MKQETQDAVTLVWEWSEAPYAMQQKSPTRDDVDFLAVLPRGQKEIPFWVEDLNGMGGCHVWKCVLGPGEFMGRVLVAVCHA